MEKAAGSLAGQLRLLEEKVEAVVMQVARLKKDNRELRERLARADEVRQRAVQRIDDALDRIDTLT